MTHPSVPSARVRSLLAQAPEQSILVLGDFMLDQFIWGRVSRISPEAPVPVVDFLRENYMPGGAANVARNLAALKSGVEMVGPVGRDDAGAKLKSLLQQDGVGCRGLFVQAKRPTSIKTRVVAHQQQVVRVDREEKSDIDDATADRILDIVRRRLPRTTGMVVGDYGKGGVTQHLLDELKTLCRDHGVWLSLDPKPVHKLDLRGLSLLTPNRKEAFELAGETDHGRAKHPLEDEQLMRVVNGLMRKMKPALMLVTLGDQGMMLCHAGEKPFHIPTTAREVYDVTGAGDTVIASFTLAIATGASPVEAALIANEAAGIVVGKVGTAVVTPKELIARFAK